jgi:hemin uptake protein HemP
MSTYNSAPFLLRSETAGVQPKPAVHMLAVPSRTLSSDAIMRGEREIGIEHHGALYRLKVTRQGKLILNK